MLESKEPLSERKSKLSAAIKKANKDSRLGLILYIIPGFPSLQGYCEMKEILDHKIFVTILETTFPVWDGFATANETIIGAHRIAWQEVQGTRMKTLLTTKKPNFAVLYRRTIESLGITGIRDHYKGIIDAATLEWDDPDPMNYAAPLQQAGIEYVPPVYPSMTLSQIKEAVGQTQQDGLFYLSCSPMTGGAMDDLSSIQKCAGLVKKLKPLSTIAAGMGLKGTADIKRLAVVEEIDAVVIGTSFLQALQKGLSDAQKFIAEIEPALYRSFIPIP